MHSRVVGYRGADVEKLLEGVHSFLMSVVVEQFQGVLADCLLTVGLMLSSCSQYHLHRPIEVFRAFLFIKFGRLMIKKVKIIPKSFSKALMVIYPLINGLLLAIIVVFIFLEVVVLDSQLFLGEISEVSCGLPLHELVTDGGDTFHVLAQVDDVPRHNTGNIIPLLFLILKTLILQGINATDLFRILEKFVLTFPLVHFYYSYNFIILFNF